jgi:hypothetical protein
MVSIVQTGFSCNGEHRYLLENFICGIGKAWFENCSDECPTRQASPWKKTDIADAQW